MTDRLSRLEIIHGDNPIYFLTLATHARQKILSTDLIHLAFQDFSHAAAERNIFVGRYIILPDHLHLFVSVPDPAALPMWVKSLKNTLSKSMRYAVPAPHWQKGYFDHVLRSECSYESKWMYVRLNPVRHGLVKNEDSWRFTGEITPLHFR